MKPLFLFLLNFLIPVGVFAWGDGHRKITVEAQAILPDRAKWAAALGEKNWGWLGGVGGTTGYAGIPDMQSLYIRRPWGECFANDYLLTREVPFLYGYHVPDVDRTKMNQELVGFAQRALQALRTETPTEAARRIGALLHLCEDCGAPAHAGRTSPPAHTVLDNALPLDRIAVPDYQPVLLGKTDEEFFRGLVQRVGGLIDFSQPIGRKLLPEATELVPFFQTDRIAEVQARWDALAAEQVPAAVECTRVVADTLFTLFTLGLTETRERAALLGKVAWAPTSLFEKSGAEILLLDARKLPGPPQSPAEIFAACTDYSTHTDEQGAFSFHNLPEGTYRVLAYRVGSALAISDPLTLAAGKTESPTLHLPPSEPAGNLLYNPDLQLSTYVAGMPDRWMALAPLQDGTGTYMSVLLPIPAGQKLHFGATLLDPATKVSFLLLPQNKLGLVQDCSRTLKLDPSFVETARFTGQGDTGQAETPSGLPSFVLVYVQTSKPLGRAIAKLWLQTE